MEGGNVQAFHSLTKGSSLGSDQHLGCHLDSALRTGTDLPSSFWLLCLVKLCQEEHGNTEESRMGFLMCDLSARTKRQPFTDF